MPLSACGFSFGDVFDADHRLCCLACARAYRRIESRARRENKISSVQFSMVFKNPEQS